MVHKFRAPAYKLPRARERRIPFARALNSASPRRGRRQRLHQLLPRPLQQKIVELLTTSVGLLVAALVSTGRPSRLNAVGATLDSLFLERLTVDYGKKATQLHCLPHAALVTSPRPRSHRLAALPGRMSPLAPFYLDRSMNVGFNLHTIQHISINSINNSSSSLCRARGVSTEWGVHAARWSRLLSGRPTSRLRLAPLHPAEPTWVSGRSQAQGWNCARL